MNLSARQKLILIDLIFRGEEPALGEIKPDLRNPLLKGGYLEIERRGRRQFILLTDLAWAWARENMGTLEGGRTKAERALSRVLRKTSEFLQDRELTLVEFLKPEPAAEKIRRAYLSASGGALKERVRISELRTALPDLERKTFDRALLELFNEGRVRLYPFDNPREVKSADERAAIDLSGVKQHLVYLEA